MLRPGVARQLGIRHPVSGVPTRSPPRDLHHERDRGAPPPAQKAVKTKGHFSSEDAARKLLYIAILNAVPAWTGTRNWTTALLAFKTRNWTTALLAFKIHFGDRLPD
jgi:hypothetical protein